MDNLCVHNKYRKKEIAPQIIQTHLFTQRYKNKKILITLFKREGRLTGIVPLTIYKTYQFHISNIKKIYLNNSSIKFLPINSQNINLLMEMLLSNKYKFNCIVIPDLPNILNIINQNIYSIYGLIQNDQLISCYFFRNSHVSYGDEYAVECFASIQDCNTDIFISGFTIALQKFSRIIKAKRITIENISDNNIIIKFHNIIKFRFKNRESNSIFFI